MNANAHQEAAAVAAASDVAVPEGELLSIPLSRLRPSRYNVRPGKPVRIASLAASIARIGLQQNLSVVEGGDGDYEVVAGRRRLAALRLLVKQRRFDAEREVACKVVPAEAARTVSLTENVQREPMHPVDEFRAFAALRSEGRSVEDIAADFGVTPMVVQRRLRLANVSPRLLADCKEGTVTLEQLMALAIVDDHAAQEASFYSAPEWQRTPEALREHLTRGEVDATRDPVAKFVGVQAYEAAGGAVRRDLFSDDSGGVFLIDPGLLDRLAMERLEAEAGPVRTEGWAWVSVAARASAFDLHRFARVRATRREPGKAYAQRIAKLVAKRERLSELPEDESDDVTEQERKSAESELDEVEASLDEIERKLQHIPADAMKGAGAIVTLDTKGAVIVHRGLMNEEQVRAKRGAERSAGDAEATAVAGREDGAALPPKALSERLVRRLSAHRTVALQAEVARHPQIALAALVHRLAQRVLLDDYAGSPISVTASAHDRLVDLAPDIAEATASLGLMEVRAAWIERLPQREDESFAAVLALPQDDLLSLLALCTALTVTAVASRESEAPAAALAGALGLDMHAWWTPTASGYFEHVSKAQALDAVREFAPDHVNRLAKLKKMDLASEAGRLVGGTGWLPAMLRGEAADVLPESASAGE
jgi:ParB family chromosome partitioning protein